MRPITELLKVTQFSIYGIFILLYAVYIIAYSFIYILFYILVISYVSYIIDNKREKCNQCNLKRHF